MNLQVFCYLGLLRFGEQLESALAMLPENDRQEASNFLASIKTLPRSEWVRGWSNLRTEEYVTLRSNFQRRSGICVDDLPPSLREQWVEWLAENHD